MVKADDQRAEFVERIERGQQYCDQGVTVVVTRIDEEYVSIAYFLPEIYDEVVAYSVLRKQDRA